MKVRLLPGLLALSSLFVDAAVSPHDFPYGYPFPDYPLAGASHPRLSNDYLKSEPGPAEDLKRIGQYALRLIQTGRAAEAVAFVDRYRAAHPGPMDQETLFMRTMAPNSAGWTRRRPPWRMQWMWRAWHTVVSGRPFRWSVTIGESVSWIRTRATSAIAAVPHNPVLSR